MTSRSAKTAAAFAVAAVLAAAPGHALYAQAKNMPAKSGTSTIRGCLQSAQGQGYVLMNPQGSPEASKTQTLTYKVVPATGAKIDLSALVNKRVEATGILSTTSAGQVPAAVPDSVRGTGGAGGSGKPGVDHASVFTNGVFTVRWIKETSGTCAGDMRK